MGEGVLSNKACISPIRAVHGIRGDVGPVNASCNIDTRIVHVGQNNRRPEYRFTSLCAALLEWLDLHLIAEAHID
jgi:hypothetical protein